MKCFSITLLAFLTGAIAFPSHSGRQMRDEQEDYERSPAHKRLRDLKQAEWNAYASTERWATEVDINTFSPCKDGVAAGVYPCHNVDLYAFVSHGTLGDTAGNDLWDWRDIKVIGNFVYIGSEARDHGLQIFDLCKLLNNTSPVMYSLSDQTAHFSAFGSSHNIVANAETQVIYAVGSNKCAGGLFAIDVSNPAKPKSIECFSGDGYVHDAQCLVYRGPDVRYKGVPICFGFNEDTLTITDPTKGAPAKIISRTAYPGAAYVHQGWLASDAQDILLSDDEYDEESRTSTDPTHATTYVWNITDLTKPFVHDTYSHTAQSIDHDLYTLNGYGYHANYASGLRITDIRNLPTPGSISTVAYFDTWPQEDAINFEGAWSTCPYFASGYVLVNSIGNGVFCLKRKDI